MSEPWVSFEDEHLLAVTKPAGINTHRADVHAQDGMFEWVQRQRPADSLAVLHRLDKATSGLLLFGKTRVANQALAAQFEDRLVGKAYDLLVLRDDGRPAALHRDDPLEGQPASTDFELGGSGPSVQRVVAHPHTGRTHQVRAHAAAAGMPILGDVEHGGAAAARVFLHSARLAFDHPASGPLELTSPRPHSFDEVLASDARAPGDDAGTAATVAREARDLLFDPADTDAYLWIDRHHDGFPGTRVERLGDVALAVTSAEDRPLQRGWIDAWTAAAPIRAVYELRRPRGGGGEPAALVAGAAHPRFQVTELGCRYLVDLSVSATSTGLFLDQRETRRRLLRTDLHGRTVLNTFAHTGSFSVAAARAGAQTLTLDLSKRYLTWAADNLRANDLDPADHDVVFGDAMEWMERFAKKRRTFDLVLVDPPSTSTTRRGGRRWVVDRDLHGLVERATRVCAPGGTLFVSTNLRAMDWPRFLGHLERGVAAAGRHGSIETQTLPLDHRVGPGDPPYLKAAWITLDEVG